MTKFTREMNVAGRSRNKVLEIVRKSAKTIGMVAENISATKRGALRSGGKQVWKVKATFRDKKKKKKRR